MYFTISRGGYLVELNIWIDFWLLVQLEDKRKNEYFNAITIFINDFRSLSWKSITCNRIIDKYRSK